MRKSTKSLCQRIALAGVAFTLVLSGSAFRATADDTTEKLQAAVAALNAEQQAALFLLLSELTGGDSKGGGSDSSGAPDAEAAFKEIVDTITASLGDPEKIASDSAVDDLMELISEDFEYYQVGGKEDLREFLQGAFDMGYIEMYGPDSEIITDDTEIEVDGDMATVYPVDVEGPWGSATLEFEAKLEGDTWRIIGLDISGI